VPVNAYHIFSAALSLALLAIGFFAISSLVGRTTFFVKERRTLFLLQTHFGNCGGQVHPFSRAFIL